MNPELATEGEFYVELLPGHQVAPHQVAFPALIDHQRSTVWVRPRFRREVADAVAEWLNIMYPADPDWYQLACFDGDTLTITAGDGPHQSYTVEPSPDGRYPFGSPGAGGWCWFLSVPTVTPATRCRETALLCDPARRIAAEGEVLVSCDPDDPVAGAFPARVDPLWSHGHPVPTFRPEIADAVIAWCNTRHRGDPDRYPQAYVDGGTLVHVHQHLRALDGYTPWRIDPDPQGRYRVDGDDWTWRRVTTPTAVSPASSTPIA